jgi:hypothetical protein
MIVLALGLCTTGLAFAEFETLQGFCGSEDGTWDAGTIVVESAAACFDGLVNTGTLIFFTLTPFDNSGEVINGGNWVNVSEIHNKGEFDNRDGYIHNQSPGVINNYRCPGSTGVISSGRGNIENEGVIQFINGADC